MDWARNCLAIDSCVQYWRRGLDWNLKKNQFLKLGHYKKCKPSRIKVLNIKKSYETRSLKIKEKI